MMPGLATAGIVVGNAVVWGLKPGKNVAKALSIAEDAYDKYVKPAVDRMQGLRPKQITIARQPDREGKLVFTFKDVSDIDFAAIEEKIFAEAKAKVDLSVMDDNVGVKLAAEDSSVILASPYNYYDVELVIDKSDVRLGEIDFSRWGRDDFHITVKKKGSTEAISQNGLEYQKVLNTLKRIAKVSADSSLTPNQIAKDKIQVSQGGIGLVDWYNSFFTVVKQHVAVDGMQHPHLQNEQYVKGLIELAADRAAVGDGDFSILENYYGAVEQSLRNKLFADKNARERLQKEVDARESERTKGQVILGLLVAGAALIVAGLVVLTVFFPPIGGPILAFLAGSAISGLKFFGSKLLAGLASFGIGALVAGVILERGKFKKERLKIAKDKLAEVKESEKELKETLENVKEVKDGAIKTLKAIKSVENSEDLEKTLDLSNRKIGSMDVALICNHLGRDDNHLQIINLNGCEIGNNELMGFKQALLTNFTVTNLIYNADGNEKALLDVDTVKEINKQLLINGCLRGVLDVGSNEQINNLFGGVEQLIAAALQKVADNVNITKLPFEINHDLRARIDSIIQQNNIFSKQLTFDGCIKAFQLDDERCVTYLRRKLSIEEEKGQIAAIQDDIFMDQSGKNLLKLKELKDPAKLLKAILVVPEKTSDKEKENYAKNIELYVRVVKNLTEDIMNVESFKAFVIGLRLQFNSAPEVFKSILKTKSSEILKSGVEQSINMFNVLDLALNPDLGDVNSQDFKKHRLEELVDVFNSSNIKKESMIGEFIDIYRDIPSDQLEFFFANFNEDRRKKLLELVKFDINSDNYGKDSYLPQLGSTGLDEKHIAVLLSTCLKGEANAVGIATLVSKLMAIKNPPVAAEYIWRIFNWSLVNGCWNFDNYIKNVEILRIEKRVTDPVVAGQIEDAIQVALQVDLVGRYACLRPTYGLEDFDSLKNFLKNDPMFLKLRKFKFPDGIDDSVKNHIQVVVNRNNLYDAIFSHQTSKEKLEKFLAIYGAIPTLKERQECLDDFMQMAGNKDRLLNLIKEDTYPNNCQILKTLEESKRVELLMASLGKDTPNASGIATLASKLMSIKDPLVLPKYIWAIFDWNGAVFGVGGAHAKWTFEQYIKELKALRNSNPSIGVDIENVIQDALQADLESKFECLHDASKLESEISELKKSLNGNYDLRRFNFSSVEQISEVGSLVVNIVARNEAFEQLRKDKMVFAESKKEVDKLAVLKSFGKAFKNPEWRASLFDFLKAEGIYTKNVVGLNMVLFADVVKNLPDDFENIAEFGGVIKNLYSAFEGLDNKQDKFRQVLEDQRKNLVKLDGGDPSNLEKKTALIRAFDLALNSEWKGNYDSPDAKKYRLKSLVEEYPCTVETFAAFVDLYKTMDPTSNLFEDINRDKLVALINKDIVKGAKMAANLKKIENPAARIAMLECCFKDEKDYKNKALLVSNMISEESILEIDSCSEIRDNYLHGAFIEGMMYSKHSYSKLKSELEEAAKRKEVSVEVKQALSRVLNISEEPKLQSEKAILSCLKKTVENLGKKRNGMELSIESSNSLSETSMNKEDEEFFDALEEDEDINSSFSSKPDKK